uniref:Uncharacterized protein n=1 Tax=uncultured marine virus TaxID=186617 RepID=A0A0F7L3K7_9VIRU|nr:hypothetical protein [uncultured marine virus]
MQKQPHIKKSTRVMIFNTNSKKQSVSSYPASIFPEPFLFSKKGCVHLYEVNGLVMGVTK